MLHLYTFFFVQLRVFEVLSAEMSIFVIFLLKCNFSRYQALPAVTFLDKLLCCCRL